MNPRIILPQGDFEGYIFDLDGTLIDSMGMHFRAWRIALVDNGAKLEVFRVNEFVDYGGRAAVDIVRALNKSYGLNMDPEKVANEKREHYLDLLANQQLPLIEETVAIVRELKEKGIPFSIGTGSALSGAQATLRSAGLDELFAGAPIVTPADVAPERGKPCPDIFLLCAERMGVAPERCIVFEDAKPGIDAAKAAGMAYALVKSTDLDKWVKQAL